MSDQFFYMVLLSSADLFPKINLLKMSFKNTTSVANYLDRDQDILVAKIINR